ncbi:phosphoadenosine phosphosulfate reductase family protein [Streptacidiphilus sp. EB129]|uniref:phosphoadenosine phosphosulfate reductase domain-containing protein n=1 Tax=Streptacidiphilus sp. EB129 TaxID=3156262 RepID=UPI003516BC97
MIVSSTIARRRRLRGYDHLVFSLSGGKDGLAALDRGVALADDAGVLDRVVALHCDLGSAEWEGAADLARAQAEHYGVAFEVRRREQGTLLDMVRHRGMWMSPRARYCTSAMKRDVARKFYTELARSTPTPGRPARLLTALGIRAEESRARAQRPVLAVDRTVSNSRKEVTVWHPVLRYSTDQVWQAIRRSGAPSHPAYAHVSRLSCRLCPLASRRDLLVSARLNPELAAEYAQVEDEIGHRFRNDWTMARIIEEAHELPPEALTREHPLAAYGSGGTLRFEVGCAA